jgi:NAD+ diphosphatase
MANNGYSLSGSASDFGDPDEVLRVGEWEGLPCYAADLTQLPEIPSGEAIPLRAIFQTGGAEVFALAGRATQLLDWQKNHRYCGHCGSATLIKSGELAMECPVAGCWLIPAFRRR